MTSERIKELRWVIEHFDQGDFLDADGHEHVMRRGLASALDALERVRELAQEAMGWVNLSGLLPDRIIAALEGTSATSAETLQERFERFNKSARPGAIFVNEPGRRSEIRGRDASRPWNGDPEDGPYYIVNVFWSDAEPSEDSMPWWTIGELEGKSG